jgi:pimeloyl-ACP methyl ester carboxylesterase
MDRSISIDGVHLAFTEKGDGAPAIVLIHGHPFNRSMWRPQVEFLWSRHRVIVPDLRGYGESGIAPCANETRLEQFAADSLALMDSLGIEKFVLGGLSMGGQIALEIYRQAPKRIEALLLADTFAGLDAPERKQLRFATADRLEREGMAQYANEELTKMITPANAESQPHVAAHVMEMMLATPPSGAAAALRGRARRVDYLPLLEKISVPTLVLVGRYDFYTPVALSEQLVQGIPVATLSVIEDAGHMPNLEQPEAFNSAVSAWLNGL